MERYFLGSNTAYGFKGYFDEELKNKRRAVLLKGGPGTGKSYILRKLAEEAKKRGLDYELWYCSGDPSSLDGIYIKSLDCTVTDATAPHATGADLPMIKDFIIDLASSLSTGKLAECKDEIDSLLKCKKWYFMRAYQHLKLALVHLHNQIELESQGLKAENIRAYASVMASNLRSANAGVRRRLFSKVICPSGESAYFDHLRGKRIYKVDGGFAARKIFFDELCGLVEGGTVILNPLDPSVADGFIVNDVAVVSDVGHFDGEVSETVNLFVYENAPDTAAIEEEKNGVTTRIALAEDCLENARAAHLSAEKYFISAMDFDNNRMLYDKILSYVFGEGDKK